MLEFLEKANVLNSDGGLVGEDLEESDLFFRERTDFSTANRNHSNWDSFSQQRRAKNSPSSSALLEEPRFRKLRVEFSGDVVDMDCRSVDHRASCRIVTTEGWRGRGWHGSIFCRPQPLQSISVEAANGCVIRFT